MFSLNLEASRNNNYKYEDLGNQIDANQNSNPPVHNQGGDNDFKNNNSKGNLQIPTPLEREEIKDDEAQLSVMSQSQGSEKFLDYLIVAAQNGDVNELINIIQSIKDGSLDEVKPV